MRNERALQIVSDINALNGAVESEDIIMGELGLSDLTFWALEREDIASYFVGDFSDDMSEWLLTGIELVVSELGKPMGCEILKNLSTSNFIERIY